VYQFNEEISITSDIQVSCAQSFSTKYQWIIYNCTSICRIFHDLNDRTVKTFDEIYIPSNTLNVGVYQLTLKVLIATKSLLFNSSTSILIKIARPVNVSVNLIEYRMSEITLGRTEDLLLEPGKYSLYTDETALIPNVSQRE
jgi:REJ domain